MSVPQRPEDYKPLDPRPTTAPCICPHCGHQHAAYDARASDVLTCLTVATEALHEAKRLVESEVLP
jgi:hypothetical protein